MIIGRSDYSLAAASMRQTTVSRVERLRMWDDRAGTGRASPEPATTSLPTTSLPTTSRDTVSREALSRAAVSRAAGRTLVQVASAPQPAAPAPDTERADGAEPSEQLSFAGRFQTLISLVEALTGRKVVVLDPSSLTGGGAADPAAAAGARGGPAGTGPTPPPARQGWGIDYSSTTTTTTAEHTAFVARGTVTTTDGREISFSVDLDLRRESVQVSGTRLRAGDAAMVDPLVLNFGGGPVELSAQKIDFDLDADGHTERISFVASGNGFLVLDRNGNGSVDDGTELFGPASGDGFAELAALDSDGNGWIDEGDEAFGQLRVWDVAGGWLRTLAERGVGAIALGRVSTPFDLEAGGVTAGSLRETGLWLGTTGTAGTIHHVDLAI